MAPATVGVGAPTGLLQALPPVVARGLPPPAIEELRSEERRVARPAGLPQTPAVFRPIGRAQLGPSVPRSLPQLPVVVGEGGWAAGCHCGGGAGASCFPCHCGSGCPHGSAQSPAPCGGAWAVPPPPDCVGPGGPAKNLPGVPPYSARRAVGRGPGWAGGPGGRSLDWYAGTDRRSLPGGAPAKIPPGFHPSDAKRARRRGPVGAAGPGGRSPSPSDGPGGHSRGRGGVPPNSLGVPPPDNDYLGGPAKNLPGVPPFAKRRASRGGMGGLMARVGAH